MNDIFSTRRFGLLFKKQLFEQPFQTFGLMGVVLIGTLIFYTPYKFNDFRYGAAQQILHFALFLGGGSLTFFMFSHFSDNSKGYSYLLLPASYFEKWLCGFIGTCVLFLGIYLAFFRLVDAAYVNAFHQELANAKSLTPFQLSENYRYIQILYYDTASFKTSLSLFFMLTGATAVGSLYFNKNAYVKIVIAIVVCVWVYVFGINFINEYFFKGVPISANNFGKVHLIEEGYIKLPKVYADIVDVIFHYCLPTILWLTALIRLREKEI